MPSYGSTSPVFEDEEVLKEEYSPEKLPERETEVRELHMALRPAARGAGANNAFLYGKAGQGKTAAAKSELEKLQLHADTESDHLNLTTLYISCESHDVSTTFRAAGRIYMELTGNDQPKGYSTGQVMDMMFEAMNDIGGTIIIVLDEIDVLGYNDKILYTLPRARAQGHVDDHVYPSVIGISNDLQWRDNLSPKVKSSLYDDQILFTPYKTKELRQILRRRSTKAFKNTEAVPASELDIGENPEQISKKDLCEIDNTGNKYLFKSEVLESGVIPKIAALCAEDTGDARQAIKYLRKSGEIVDMEGKSVITEDTVDYAQSKVEKETVIEAIREMTTQAHLTLSALTLLEKSGYNDARTREVYGLYKELADAVDTKQLVQRRVRDHLLDLKMQGVINAEKKTGGSEGGPSWHFSLRVNTDVATEVLNNVSRLDTIHFENIKRYTVTDLDAFK